MLKQYCNTFSTITITNITSIIANTVELKLLPLVVPRLQQQPPPTTRGAQTG